jgi:ATP-dependent DNA helicase UvrD/PcrA
MPDISEEVLASRSLRICVIAAPGSGKTKRVLIPKASQILANTAVDPKTVLLLTFSRLSAQDLRNRVEGLERVPRASTVHSICLAFLLSEDNHGVRKRIESVVLDFEKELLLDDLRLVFPHRSKRQLRTDLKRFSAGWATTPHAEVFESNDEQRAFKAAVISWLSEHEAAMMEEIVYEAVDLARKLGAPAFIVEPQYIFVDEFQDLNQLEQEFIELLAQDSKLLLVVGDPNQSIYSFKYAHPQGIVDFAGQAGVESKVSLKTFRCPRKIVNVANELLKQAQPATRDLLQPANEEEGEVHFVRRSTQQDEFQHVLTSIAEKLRSGAEPSAILVLVPRKEFGGEFAQYATEHASKVGIRPEVRFEFVLKPDFEENEREAILKFALLAKPDSLLHARAFVGLGSANSYAPELKKLKEEYGSLTQAMQNTRASEIPKKRKTLRQVAERIEQLRKFLEAHRGPIECSDVTNELFPEESENLGRIRAVLEGLREHDDTIEVLYRKFVDYLRTIPSSPQTVRVMTLMASKGLEAAHVYIMGCNSGNLPGQNRSAHLSDHDHKAEQRRLLFVGVTRTTKTLTISWSRLIPFGQSKRQSTPGVRIVRSGGQVFAEVSLSEFLQDLPGVNWE